MALTHVGKPCSLVATGNSPPSLRSPWRSAKEELTAFIERADKALYHAKETGRNLICALENPA
ncbi:MAG: hypothetical protein ACU833_07860 [Gammaproteobacteria bacterium]